MESKPNYPFEHARDQILELQLQTFQIMPCDCFNPYKYFFTHTFQTLPLQQNWAFALYKPSHQEYQ